MKRRLIIATVALLLPLPGQAVTQDAPLGKLFLTPDKRQALDRQRASNSREADSVESDTLQLDGVVQRSSGRHSVWINQRMHTENDQGISVEVHRRNPGAADISAPRDAPTRLRVGESLDRGSGERRDVVAPGGVSIGHAPPKP